MRFVRVARVLTLSVLVASLLATIAVFLGGHQAAYAEAAVQPPGNAPEAGWIGKTDLFPVKTGSNPGWEKRWWIDKTARLLRGGEGLGPDDDLPALLALSEDEIARRFMADPRFGDTILDFNLYFLGFKPDSLKIDGVYKRAAFDFANAVSAAQALLKGGDYLSLFDLKGAFYMAPLRKHGEDPAAVEDAGLSAAQLRIRAMGEVRSAFYSVMAFGAGPGRPNGDDFCDRVLALVNSEDRIKARLDRAFDDAEIFVLTRGQVLYLPFRSLAGVAREECDGQPEAYVEIPRLMAALKNALDEIDRAFAAILAFDPEQYQPRSVAEFKRFDLSAFPAGSKWLAFGFEQGVALANSSTNFNRKRAAYVLKRFFCDDIVASPPEPPVAHPGAANATSSCAACHTKLDPMAGFFRNYGAFFFDYSKSPVIVFDDLATTQRDDYVAKWHSQSKAVQGWDVGFIRSAPSASAYGRSLDDLSRIVRTAPEAKRCLMRRLFEYFVAEDQMIDGAYLDSLTRQFEQEAKVDSAAAMKNAIVRVVSSGAYRQRDADPRQCYDHAPGARPEDAPPCRITFIVNKNCTSCHDSIYGGDANLDLTALIESPDGKGRTFPHLDDGMAQRNARDTFARLVERLTTPDPKRRMPKGRIMRNDERDELLRWARDELARISNSAGP